MSGGFWSAIWFVGLGGFVGSVLRYGVYELVVRLDGFEGFPYATLIVNLGGSLAIGALLGIAETRSAMSPELRMFLFVGMLGGFTTFSTFALEGFELIRVGQIPTLLVTVGLHTMLGFVAVALGYTLARAH